MIFTGNNQKQGTRFVISGILITKVHCVHYINTRSPGILRSLSTKANGKNAMEEVPHSLNPETLLSHTGFVRNIALSLLQDENRADDAAQETWLAVVKHPPLDVVSVRDWLATVTKNFARVGIREERRRRKRERIAARSEVVRSTGEIVEQENTRRRVVKAVLSLSEPNRTAILFRFYDDLPPREIAKICGIPVETVKTRIQRGLRQLKKRLDAYYGGDRKSWCKALLPLAGLKVMASGAGAATAVGVGGMFRMAVAVVLIVGSILTLGSLLMEEESLPIPEVADRVESPKMAASDIEETEDALAAAAMPEAKEPAPIARIEHKGPCIQGSVQDLVTGEPVKAFHFGLIGPEETGMSGTGYCIYESVKDEEGRFSFPLDRGGTYALIIRSSHHIMKELARIKISGETGLKGVEVELDPGLSVKGKVVDLRSGQPIEGALVGTDGRDGALFTRDLKGFGEELERGFNEYEIHARTDEKGSFQLSGLQALPQRITAVHAGYAQGWAEFDPETEGELFIPLQQGFRITGLVYSDDGEPVPGIRIFMDGESSPLIRSYTSASDGRFQTDPTSPGTVRVWSDPRRPRGKKPFFTPELKIVEIKDRDVEVVFSSTSSEYVTWHGKVFHEGSLPLKAAMLIVYPDAGYPWKCPERMGVHQTRFIALGEKQDFNIRKLLPGRYRVQIRLDGQGQGWDLDGGVVTFDQPGTIERHLRFGGASICGVVLDGKGRSVKTGGGMVIARCADPQKDKEYSSFLDGDGRFSLSGLEAGIYCLWAADSLKDPIWGSVDGIRVERNEKIDGVRIRLPGTGDLRILLKEFDYSDFNRFIITLAQGDKGYIFAGTELIYDMENKTGEFSRRVEEGFWILSFTYQMGKYFGFLEKRFEVLPGRMEEVAIFKDQFPLSLGSMKVAGQLTCLCESLLEKLKGGKLVFKPCWSELEGLKPFFGMEEEIGAEIDAQGRFELDDLPPGRWEVEGITENGDRISLPEQVVPLDSSGVSTLDVAVPLGSVSGILVDEGTGKALGNGGPDWTLSLYDREILARFDPCVIYFSNPFEDLNPVRRVHGVGDRFLLDGVRGGNYFLLADVEGYEKHLVEFVPLAEGQELDIGEVILKPCAAFRLEITLRGEQPLGTFFVTIDGMEYASSDPCGPVKKKSDSLYLCDRIPSGHIEVKVGKEGYKTERFDLYLDPGDTGFIRVELIPK